MRLPFVHPATVELLRLQSHGRARRMWSRFCQPRRLVLSAVACVLAVVWLGNAAMTIWLRETGSPLRLQALLSVGLVFYAGWHFVKSAFFRPESPFDWSPGEREILAAMPWSPRELIAHQLASVTATTVLKAGMFTLLLWPDLRCVPLGLAGVLLAMLLLEMIRLAIEIVTWGMSKRAFFAYRVAVMSGLVIVGSAASHSIFRDGTFVGRIDLGDGVRERLLDFVVHLQDSAIGYLTLPFEPFVELMLADRVSLASMSLCLADSIAVLGMVAVVVGLYTLFSQFVASREKRSYAARFAADGSSDAVRDPAGRALAADFALRLWCFPRWGGAGALVWRQLVGARRHWGGLLTAMIAPAILAGIPGMVIADPNIAFLATTGTLAFYTFLLLPTALRFDFRRDLDRLATLKGLPITARSAVLGQTMAPVFLASVFQAIVLAFIVAARSLPPHFAVTAMLVMIPLNVLVFGLDNLIYLLYPYRMQQEGLEVFLRTMLTFTGKGLLFVLAMTAMSVWGFATADLTRTLSHWTGTAIDPYAVFTAGMIGGPSCLAAIVLYGLCETYGRMNPIEDLPR